MSRRQPGNRKRVTQAGFESQSAIQIARPTWMFSSSGRHNDGLRTVMVYSGLSSTAQAVWLANGQNLTFFARMFSGAMIFPAE